MKDWYSWHTHYDEPNSDLAVRLQVVQEKISEILPEQLDFAYQIIDICAGDGRDLIPVLANYPHASYVHSSLIEIDNALSDASKALAINEHVANISFDVTDASLSSVYVKIIPADLILLCGVFGNISDEDVENTIRNLPMFCKPGTKILWTRNIREPDATPRIRQLFSENSFTEIEFIIPDHNTYAIGISEFRGAPKPFDGNVKLFTFMR